MSSNPNPPPTPIQAFWYNAHGIGLTILWCLCADTLLLIVRYVKNWHKYLLLHSLFGVVNLLTLILVTGVVVVDRSWIFNWPGFSTMTLSTQIHYIVGMIFVGVIIGVQVLGLVVKSQLESNRIEPEIMLRKKKIHMIIGYSIYGLSKAQLVLGWFVPGPTWATMMTVLLVYYVIFFGVKFLYLERLYGNQDQRIYIPIFQQKAQSLLNDFDNIAEMLECNTPTRKILESHPLTPYVMFKDKLYDISNFVHPGGNYLLQELKGEQISRYIYGAYPYELSHAPPHKHTIYAHKMLSQRFVCDVDLSTTKLLVPKIGDHVNVPAIWSLRKIHKMGPGIKCFIFESVRYAITSQPNIGYLGRHFLMSRPGVDMAPRLYTLALCMSDSHRTYIDSVVAALKGEVKAINDDSDMDRATTQRSLISISGTDLPDVISELPFVIKEYKVGGLSEHLHSMQIGDEIRLEGPFGRGLELESGHFLAICGGTGVIPLLDLVYQILLELHRQSTSPTSPSRLPTPFHLTMYLSLNTTQDLESLSLIPTVYLLCQQLKTDLFSLHLRISKGNNPEGIPRFERRLDQRMLKDLLRESKEITMALVCGSPDMNYTVGNVLRSQLGKDRVHIL